MSKSREKRSIEFRTLRRFCGIYDEGDCCDTTKWRGGIYPKCNAGNCSTWKRLKKLNYVARTKDDGAFYEVYWVKAK